MTERDRIILGMSLCELDALAQIGGRLPAVAAVRLDEARRLVTSLVEQHGAEHAEDMLPSDHLPLLRGTAHHGTRGPMWITRVA